MTKEPVRNVRPKPLPAGLSPMRRFERLLLRHGTLNILVGNLGKIALSAFLWPRFVAPFRWQLTRYPLPLAADPAFNGYKILHLTDLHAGKAPRHYLLRCIDQALAAQPDIVVITGDLIDYSPFALSEIQAILTHLVDASRGVRDGILATFGNHDYHEYSWRHTGPRSANRSIQRRLVKIVQESGVRLLRNESVRVTRPSAEGNGRQAELIFVGLDEMWSGLADAGKAFSGLTPRDAIICLQHNPDGIDFLQPCPWQYMLCGHSHGGQANFPFVGPIYVPMNHREYLQGFFHFPLLPGQPKQLQQRTMFVSRGMGYSTPIRMHCPPESTLFAIQVLPRA